MALDLFANFERSSNNTVFYRLTSDGSGSPRIYSVSIKLSDMEVPDVDLGSQYYVLYSLNSETPVEFPSPDGFFVTNLDIDTSSPCVCSVDVTVYQEDQTTLVNGFTLSAVILSSYPTAEIIAYPQTVINESARQLVSLNSTNYTSSSGLYFYGEGHTENIILSTTLPDASHTANWYIGNNPSQLINPSNRTSVFEITANPVTSPQLVSQVKIRSNISSLDISYPVSLFVTNDSILTTGSILKYNDNGTAGFYPFFKSSLTPNDELNSSVNKFYNNIIVKIYPDSSPTILENPFPSSALTLPLDYTNQLFLATLQTPPGSGILSETFASSQWQINAETSLGDEWSVMTEELSTILGYQFPLGYNPSINQNILPAFKASTIVPTTITLNVSSYKTVKINLASDWKSKKVYSVVGALTKITALPITEVYTPNYFNLKGEKVLFAVANDVASPYSLYSLTLESEKSSTILTLSGATLSGEMVFNEIGLVDLTATSILQNTTTQEFKETTTVFQDIIEVVLAFDVANPDYYRTTLTPIALKYTQAPNLSPNEWATADNINSVIQKLYETVSELDNLSHLYQKKDKFYAYIGLNSYDLQNFKWLDLECPSSNDEQAPWSSFECETGMEGNNDITWGNHICDTQLESQDPACLQKYCISWRWKSRKCGASNLGINISWNKAKKGSSYAKKWAFESCELVTATPFTQSCVKGKWKVFSIDPEQFPIQSCQSSLICTLVDVQFSETTNHIILAYPTELNLVRNDYAATNIDREPLVDEMFGFQNIVGLTTSIDGKIFVLDQNLPRVSVFEITENKFRRFNSWGGFGLKNNSLGFNKPNDIHIDSENYVWIADTGNNCIKKFASNGRGLMTITHEKFDASSPRSVCVDSQLNVHVLIEGEILVFDNSGSYQFSYTFPVDVVSVSKINTSYNREMIYVTYNSGIIKFFRNGSIAYYTIKDYECASGDVLQGYNSIAQDSHRNVYVTVGEKLLKIADLMNLTQVKSNLSPDLYWDISKLLVHKEEYIQPWVYLKSFHRLWDNIELLRSSLFYEETGCKSYKKPSYDKSELVIGQNEIVTNAVINRLSNQLWTNLVPLVDYFDPTCEERAGKRRRITVTPGPTPTFTSTPTPTETPTETVTISTPAPTNAPIRIVTGSFDVKGGTPSSIPSQAGPAPFIVTAPSPAPTRSQYILDRWNPSLQPTSLIIANQTFSAVWVLIPPSPITVRATFDPNGGTPTPAYQEGPTDNTGFLVNAPTTVVTKPNSTFAGWSPTVPRYIASNTTFIAQWNTNIVATFDTDGGLPAIPALNGINSLFVPLPSQAITKTGATLINWIQTSPNPGIVLTSAGLLITTNTNFKAIWNTQTNVTASFNTQGGTPVTIASQSGASPLTVIVPTTPTKTGSIFNGWTPILNTGTQIYANTTFNAQWSTPTVDKGIVTFVNSDQMITFTNNTEMYPLTS